MRIGKRRAQPGQVARQGETATTQCALQRTCPSCRYTLEALATRCPRCLASLPGWSCTGCNAQGLCHPTK